MAAPSGIVWGSIAGSYARLGIYVKLTSTATQTTRHTEVWIWTKYSLNDTANTFYYDDNKSSATTSKGSVSVNTTVTSGEGWSTSNQQKLKEYDYTFTRGTSSSKRYTAAKLTGIERVGATMTVSTSYTIPALTSYTISYNANGGSGAPASQKKYYGITLTISSTKPTRTGYTFQGWALTSTGTVYYTSGSECGKNENLTLYAVWKANTYTIKYNANGGTGAPASQTKTHAVTLTLSSTKPTRASDNNDGVVTSYTFKGWSTSSTATSASYAAGAKYTANANTTLYAVWGKSTTVNTYDVTYNTNGGSEVNSQTKTKGTALTLRSTIPTKKGFTFAGWGLSEDATTVSYNAGASYTKDADIILYAVWTPWTHTVQFNLNGGTGTVPASFTKTTNIDVMITGGTISKDGCIFKCWSTKSNGSNGKNYYIGDAYDDTKNGGTVTLYAIWKENKILIYNANKNCEAVEFIETDEIIGFDNKATVYASKFIEDGSLILGETGFHFGEIIER